MILVCEMLQRPLLGNLLRCGNYITFVTSLIVSNLTCCSCFTLFAHLLFFSILGKNSVRNLQYGPRTRLVRGMYHFNKITTVVTVVYCTFSVAVFQRLEVA